MYNMTIIFYGEKREEGKLILNGIYVNKQGSKRTIPQMKEDAVNQITNILRRDNHRCKEWKPRVTKFLASQNHFIVTENTEEETKEDPE